MNRSKSRLAQVASAPSSHLLGSVAANTVIAVFPYPYLPYRAYRA